MQEFLLYNCANVLQPPPQSPELNPIENLWGELDGRIRKTVLSLKEELKKRLTEEWQQIDRHVIQQERYPTRY